MRDFYSRHNPEQLSQVDDLAAAFLNDQAVLNARMWDKYGEDLTSIPDPSPPPPDASDEASASGNFFAELDERAASGAGAAEVGDVVDLGGAQSASMPRAVFMQKIEKFYGKHNPDHITREKIAVIGEKFFPEQDVLNARMREKYGEDLWTFEGSRAPSAAPLNISTATPIGSAVATTGETLADEEGNYPL